MTESNQTINPFKTAFIFGTGIAVGYVVNLFLSEGIKNKHKEQLMRIKEGISVETFEELTSNLFGKATKEMQQRMNEMLEQFQSRIESVKDTAESVDTKKYQKLVNDFTSSIQKDYELSKDQMEKLETFLKSDYQKVLQASKSK